MNTMALNGSAAEQKPLAPDDQEDTKYLAAMQQKEKRDALIRFLKLRGLL